MSFSGFIQERNAAKQINFEQIFKSKDKGEYTRLVKK